ncbi:unnamed protein product [Rotaria sp. Silwood1]|nr:unnamed protein product [Rotaria sp. Silwood1]CAF3436769.1 unnamed protein product [Rotaria sp. Silwood1]
MTSIAKDKLVNESELQKLIVSHYPSKVFDVILNPIPPIHLPPQYAIILKYVPKMVSCDEVHEAMLAICYSKFSIEEMKSSITNKSRHIRIDIASKDVVRKILNGGVLPLDGYLIEIVEFLAPPQILMCTWCNRPEHTIREYKETVEKCRRCGMNKLDGDHLQCSIKCHHCEDDHLVTDYRCPIISNFRKELIDELRKRPELLPQNVQIFIPVEYRDGGKNSISGKRANYLYSQLPASTPQLKEWPPLLSALSKIHLNEHNANAVEDMLNQENSLKNDYEKLKLEFNRCENELMIKHENYNLKLGSMLYLLMIQNNQQNDCITKIYTIVNKLVPIINDSLTSVRMCPEKIIRNSNDTNLKKPV